VTRQRRACLLSCIAAVVLLSGGAARAASNDEIQVYDDTINKPGELGVDVHTNYVVSGLKMPQWPGDSPSNHSFRATPEFNYGLSDGWDAGLYLPFLREANGGRHLEGVKLRLKYVSAPKDSVFYWGCNEELGRVSLRSSDQHWNLEVRPIFGYHMEKWHFTVNPALGVPLTGPGGSVDFSPSLRVRYELREDFAFGVEHYAGLGNPFNPSPYDKQTQNTYVVVDSEVAGHAVNFGIGRGWNANSDKWTVKAIIGTVFN